MSKSNGHETLCNRLHPNTLCTSKLIEFQSKQLNALITFLLGQQSTTRNDVHRTSTITKNQINYHSTQSNKTHSQKDHYRAATAEADEDEKEVKPILTTDRTIEVDAYYRFLCRKRHTKLLTKHRRPSANEPLNGKRATFVATGNDFTTNWQSKQHKIANTNIRNNNDANNERYIQLHSN